MHVKINQTTSIQAGYAAFGPLSYTNSTVYGNTESDLGKRFIIAAIANTTFRQTKNNQG
jgi:hypothetical protein